MSKVIAVFAYTDGKFRYAKTCKTTFGGWLIEWIIKYF